MKGSTPSDIPMEVAKFSGKLKQLQVGNSGKVGLLDVELQSRDSKTVITKQFAQAPLQIQRALYPEVLLPGMAYLYVISSSGGILQGDRYETNITLKDRAISHITTQGATRVYSMNSDYATQIVNITVEKDSYLEYIPDQIIPYENSRYYQRVNLNVHDDATVIYSEVLTSGRLAMGESFKYDICYLRTSCKNQDGKIRFLENSKVEPKKSSLRNFGVLGQFNTVGTIYVLTCKEKTVELEKTINNMLKDTKQVSSGTSLFSDESGIIIRILSNSTDMIYKEIFKTLEIIRKDILGAATSEIRKN